MISCRGSDCGCTLLLITAGCSSHCNYTADCNKGRLGESVCSGKLLKRILFRETFICIDRTPPRCEAGLKRVSRQKPSGGGRGNWKPELAMGGTLAGENRGSVP